MAGALSTAGRAFDSAAAYPGLFAWTWFGWIGVELFFVISGFVIAYSAEHATARAFLRSRLLRLVPAVWICATLTALVSLAIGRMGSVPHVLRAYLDCVLFVPVEPWLDGVYWTLGVEIAFYALVFALLRLGRFRSVGPVCAAVGGASTLFWVATWLCRVSARRGEPRGRADAPAPRLLLRARRLPVAVAGQGPDGWTPLRDRRLRGRDTHRDRRAAESFLFQMSRSESPLLPAPRLRGLRPDDRRPAVRGNAWRAAESFLFQMSRSESPLLPAPRLRGLRPDDRR
ncbi:hypothetical protein CTI14_14985, partial [Methylobacterium radiotolerans]